MNTSLKMERFFILFSILTLQCFLAQHIEDNFCGSHPDALQCMIEQRQNKLPQNFDCNPFADGEKCVINDLIREDIAACKTESINRRGFKGIFATNIDSRCKPKVFNVDVDFQRRLVAQAENEQICVPVTYQKVLACGSRGTRCVCDSVVKGVNGNHMQHKCRCQWFIDYCQIKSVCSHGRSVCKSAENVQCRSGSLNQCILNPEVCGKNSYCVELEDVNAKWKLGDKGDESGYACFRKDIYGTMKTLAPFCEFGINDHILTGSDFKRPQNRLDYCCYQHLTCVDKAQNIGGYLFQKRPCYCNIQLRKCCIELTSDARFRNIAHELIRVTEQVSVCSFNDKSTCNPQNPSTCTIGELIDPSIAHCEINCHTGPLLPVEVRACRIRQCTPQHNSEKLHVIDVPYHKESSLCTAVKGLPIECGLDHTRCVCDGKPSTSKFTDRCRCQFWIDSA